MSSPSERKRISVSAKSGDGAAVTAANQSGKRKVVRGGSAKSGEVLLPPLLAEIDQMIGGTGAG